MIFSGTTFCDSSGIGMLMGRYKIMQALGGSVAGCEGAGQGGEDSAAVRRDAGDSGRKDIEKRCREEKEHEKSDAPGV